MPSLKNLEKEDFSRLLKQYRKLSIETFLSTIQFSEQEIKEMGFSDIKTEYDTIENEDVFVSLKSNDNFRLLYERKRNEAKKTLEGYLKINGIKRGAHISVVDVGWKGTMQDNIWNLFEGDIFITGLYLGYSREGENNANSLKRGLLFDYVNYGGCPEISSDIFAFNSFLYEMILVAEHGRTECYSDSFTPILKVDDDIRMYEEYAKSIQDEIYNKFSLIFQLKGTGILDKKEVLYFEKLHGKMFKKLSLKDVNFIDNLILLHRDGFGNKKSGSAFGNKVIRMIKTKYRPYLRMKGFYNYKNGIEKW